MPRQASGIYQQPASTAAVSGQLISSSAYNTLTADIGSEITNSLDRSGRSAMSAALPMGSNKITGMADPVNATDAATKQYVDNAANLMFSTGDAKITLKNVADTGWIMADDGTIGNSTSGASTLADTTQALALFTLIWNRVPSTTFAPIFDSAGTVTTRGANAAADFAASKRLSITKVLGRALAIAGAGSGLTSHVVGEFGGAETVNIVRAGLPNITLNVNSGGVQANGVPDSPATTPAQAGAGINVYTTGNFALLATESMNGNVTQTGTSVVQPSSFWNVMIKL